MKTGNELINLGEIGRLFQSDGDLNLKAPHPIFMEKSKTGDLYALGCMKSKMELRVLWDKKDSKRIYI